MSTAVEVMKNILAVLYVSLSLHIVIKQQFFYIQIEYKQLNVDKMKN